MRHVNSVLTALMLEAFDNVIVYHGKTYMYINKALGMEKVHAILMV